jgi:hypothetical protein
VAAPTLGGMHSSALGLAWLPRAEAREYYFFFPSMAMLVFEHSWRGGVDLVPINWRNREHGRDVHSACILSSVPVRANDET